MMVIEADYHTHTVFSHGKNTPEENIQAALEKGLKKIAIADHAPGHIFYGVRNMQKYIRTIEGLKEKYAGKIEVLLGLELNIASFDGRLEIGEDVLKKLDIALIGYHKAVRYRDIKSARHFYMKSAPKSPAEAILEINTQSYLNALKKHKIDIIAHPGYGIPLDHAKLAEFCAAQGVLIEINASHHELTPENLAVYRESGVRFVISSDAHSRQDVGEFADAPAIAKNAGIGPERIANAAEV